MRIRRVGAIRNDSPTRPASEIAYDTIIRPSPDGPPVEREHAAPTDHRVIGVELTEADLKRVEDLIRTATAPRRRWLWPSALATLFLAGLAAGIYFWAIASRAGVNVEISTSLPDNEVTMTDAAWHLPEALLSELRVEQALGSQVELDLPVPADECERVGKALGATPDEMSSCSAAVLSLHKPLTVSWSQPQLLTHPDPQDPATRISVLPLSGGERLGLRIDITAPGAPPRWCFPPSPSPSTLELDTGGTPYSTEVGEANLGVDCDSGLRIILGQSISGGSPPALLLRGIQTFQLTTENRSTFIPNQLGPIVLGSAGARTFVSPTAVTVKAGQTPLDTDVFSSGGAASMTVNGSGVTVVSADDIATLVPNRWQDHRDVLFPITTGFLAAAVASLAAFMSVMTQRAELGEGLRHSWRQLVQRPRRRTESNPSPRSESDTSQKA